MLREPENLVKSDATIRKATYLQKVPRQAKATLKSSTFLRGFFSRSVHLDGISELQFFTINKQAQMTASKISSSDSCIERAQMGLCVSNPVPKGRCIRFLPSIFFSISRGATCLSEWLPNKEALTWH